MTKLSDPGPSIPGKRHEGEPDDEDENFYICKVCGQPVDMRDLRQVIWHEQPRHKPLKPELVKKP
ncbi:hypothetical protein FJ970_32475 (plasmid) [Mesorhizobium sp. B2-1-8]|uniref:hypothetical protein n=1 Tax=Mesorhizobium sp. B2-1-8 TaxID=2589967 RepID=UPI00112DAB34|nr:hypothetical protein [Mesorhizobium sp. B2-1-8]UCI22648.1 hypothetical protein FJ970_32475 [Mesorhizobium sp. B2-1-8]